MANIERYVRTEIQYGQKGEVISEKVSESTKKITRVKEPDYIKLYTEIWRDESRNKIPIGYRPLFLELASRMEYCDSDDLEHSQVVQTGGTRQKFIMKALGIKSRDSLQKGLKALCDCNAIRRVSRGVYQINPQYAAKGQWKYNPRVSRSSLEALADYYEHQRRKEEKGAQTWVMDKPGIEKPETGIPKTEEAGTEKTAEGQPLDLEHWD